MASSEPLDETKIPIKEKNTASSEETSFQTVLTPPVELPPSPDTAPQHKSKPPEINFGCENCHRISFLDQETGKLLHSYCQSGLQLLSINLKKIVD